MVGVDWREAEGECIIGVVVSFSSVLLIDAATWAPITPSPCKLMLRGLQEKDGVGGLRIRGDQGLSGKQFSEQGAG